ncbi:MAG: PAS domain-containing protein [Deltaproteobacteria bacterium]|nr:PAS domain-containing protein [Deltaproteobacteria bacterium]MBN2673381.1 PAS domain-containing protein [Deltaproteobacteria bacterium]
MPAKPSHKHYKTLTTSDQQLAIEARRTFESLQKNDTFINAVFESIQDGISVLDTELRIVHTNGVMKEWYNQNLPLEGKHCYKCYHNSDSPCSPCPTLDCLKSGKAEHQIVPGLPGSSVEWVELHSFPMKDPQSGEIIGVVEFVRDITARRRNQEIILQSEKMMSVGGLAAGMAHEINNPLAGISQNIDVLVRRLTDMNLPANIAAAESIGIPLESIRAFMERREIPHMLASIKESSVRISDIVSNMLSFARKADDMSAPCHPGELVDEVLELARTDYNLKQNYDFKNVTVQRNIDQNLPVVICQKSKIQQVLLNLLMNAAHAVFASNCDTPTISVRVSVFEALGQLQIEIEDNGIGMDADVRDRIFEPFFTTKAPGIGTGLGLSVSYFIITEDHKGTIDVFSAPGKGTTFRIRLPLNGPSGADR